jgi:hypothetical protein
VEEYCDGSSEIVVRDISDGILLGYFIRLLLFVARTGKFLILARGEGSGDGVGILSSFSLGRTYAKNKHILAKLHLKFTN